MITVNITNVRVEEELGAIVVTADVPDLEGHPGLPSVGTNEDGTPMGTEGDYWIPFQAIADRRAGYNLESDEEAIDAIMREHMVRIGGLPPEGPKLADRLGGLHADVTVDRGGHDDALVSAAQDAQVALDTVLQPPDG